DNHPKNQTKYPMIRPRPLLFMMPSYQSKTLTGGNSDIVIQTITELISPNIYDVCVKDLLQHLRQNKQHNKLCLQLQRYERK
ncbi:MAG: hypothetical protein ACI8RD_007347, partial [Bacillariaceae sp.]